MDRTALDKAREWLGLRDYDPDPAPHIVEAIATAPEPSDDQSTHPAVWAVVKGVPFSSLTPHDQAEVLRFVSFLRGVGKARQDDQASDGE